MLQLPWYTITDFANKFLTLHNLEATIAGWFPSTYTSCVIFIMYIVICQLSILLNLPCNTVCTFSKKKK